MDTLNILMASVVGLCGITYAFMTMHTHKERRDLEDIRFYKCGKCNEMFQLHKSKGNKCPKCNTPSRQLKHW